MVIEHIIGLVILITVTILICIAGKMTINLVKIFKGLFFYGINIISDDRDSTIRLSPSMYETIKQESTDSTTYRIRLFKTTLSQYIESIRTITQNNKAVIIIKGQTYELNEATLDKIKHECFAVQDECLADLTVYSRIEDH